MYDPDTNEFFRQMEQGIRCAAEQLAEYGVSVKLRYAGYSDPPSIVRQLEEAEKDGTSGIATAGLNTEPVASKLSPFGLKTVFEKLQN